MTVTFLNKTRLPASLRGKTPLLARAVRKALKRAKGEVTVKFLSDAEMRRLNKDVLGHDYVTDVISFDYAPDADIAICVPQAARQAKELGHPLLTELLTLAAHGALHLVGYDDHSPKKKKAMFSRQDAIVRTLI